MYFLFSHQVEGGNAYRIVSLHPFFVVVRGLPHEELVLSRVAVPKKVLSMAEK